MHSRIACALALGVAVLTSACSTSTASPSSTATAPSSPSAPPSIGKTISVTLVTDVGGLHDASFNQEAWSALRHAHRTSGIRVRAIPSTSDTAYLANLLSAVHDRSMLIVAIGYSMSRAVYEAAHASPTSRFLLVDARPIDPAGLEVSLANVQNLLFREQESGYAAGVIAAGMARTGAIGPRKAIGYLSGPSIPQVDHYIAGFIAGAHATDPAVQLIGQSTVSFTSPAQGTAAANAEVNAGAGVVFQVAGETGIAFLQQAERRGAYAIGVDSDMRYLGPRVITSAVKNVNVALEREVNRLRHGTFRAGDVRLGASEGATGLAPVSPVVPAPAARAARLSLRRMAAGRLHPPLYPPAR